MIDIHNHIIYGVDDGPTMIEDSIKMLLEAQRLGITTIITTPHYNKEVYSSEKVLDNFNEIKARTSDFGINFFLGYEVFLCSSLQDILSEKEKYTLDNSKYLLYELPFGIMPLDLDDTLIKIISGGIVPVIAHPERDWYFVSSMKNFQGLLGTGCLVQVDAASIVGVYGSKIKEFTKNIIKQNLVHFVASDAHQSMDYTKWYLQAYDQVKNWSGVEYCDKIFTHNQNIILTTRNHP